MPDLSYRRLALQALMQNALAPHVYRDDKGDERVQLMPVELELTIPESIALAQVHATLAVAAAIENLHGHLEDRPIYVSVDRP